MSFYEEVLAIIVALLVTDVIKWVAMKLWKISYWFTDLFDHRSSPFDPDPREDFPGQKEK